MATNDKPSSSSSSTHPHAKHPHEGGKGKPELPRELPDFPPPTSGDSGDSGNPTTTK
jgi:hypothetical protein